MIDSIVFDNCIKTEDRIYYLVMLDYDDMPEHEVSKDIKRLQDRYGLHMASLYRTKHGFHAVFFYDCLTSWKDCMDVILASLCDQKYKDVAVKTGKVNTRISVKYSKPDKEFIRHVYPDKKLDLDSNTCKMIKEGNRIHELYDRLIAMGIDLNKDIWTQPVS
ncbi:hypothetical protein GQ472_06120 [archaeon]|nr:hypothetical protein [archaeon]